MLQSGKPVGPQKTNAAVTTAAVTPAAINIFSPSMFVFVFSHTLCSHRFKSENFPIALIFHIPSKNARNFNAALVHGQ